MGIRQFSFPRPHVSVARDNSALIFFWNFKFNHESDKYKSESKPLRQSLTKKTNATNFCPRTLNRLKRKHWIDFVEQKTDVACQSPF